MAQGFELGIPEDFLQGLIESDFYDIAEKALEKTAPVLEESMRSSVKAVMVGGDTERTGDAVNSITHRGPKKTSTDGMIVNVGPTGYSKHKYNKKSGSYELSNAMKLIWLEYGNRNGSQIARSWLTPAINSCKEQILESIQQTWEDMTDEH